MMPQAIRSKANYTYSGLSTVANDGVKSTTTVQDALGRVVSVTDPGGTVTYSYFANGNLKSTNYGSSIQTLEQNQWGEKTKLNDPSAGVYTYSYNGWGDITSEITPKGTTTYTYDAAGKLTGKSIVGSGTNMVWTYTYNPTTKLPTTASLVNADGNNTTYSYTYDTYRRLTGTTEDNPYATFVTSQTYDSFGRVGSESLQATDKHSSKTASRGLTHTYQNGELLETTMQGTGQTIWRFLTENSKGMLTGFRQSSNIQTGITYDTPGYPQQIQVQRTGSSPTTLMTLGYSFNAARGFPNSRTNSLFSWSESFSYDNLDRLTVFNDNNGNHNQAYDTRGRITSNSRLGTYTYSGTSYRQTGLSLTPTASTYYQTRAVQDIDFNAFKSPNEINEPGHDRYSFQYNGFMQRASMFYGGEQTDKLLRPKRRHYSADGSMEISKNLTTGTTDFIFYLGGDAYSAPAIWKERHSSSPTIQNLYYLQRDYLGSIVLITDASGNAVEKRQFDAWGNIVKLTDGSNNNIPTFVIIDRGYTGHEHLQSAGLIHMNARLYDPLLGRFVSPDNYVQDPLGTQNYNRYAYAMNNPMMYVDQNGEWISLVIGAVVGGITNWLFNGAEFTWNGLGYFGVGAVAGAVSGGIGAGVSSALGGGTFAAGFLGTASASTVGSGFTSGAIIGASSGSSGGFLTGFGNSLVGGNSFGNSLLSGFTSGAFGAIGGGVFGGFGGGIDAWRDGRNFWSGAGESESYLFLSGEPTNKYRFTSTDDMRANYDATIGARDGISLSQVEERIGTKVSLANSTSHDINSYGLIVSKKGGSAGGITSVRYSGGIRNRIIGTKIVIAPGVKGYDLITRNMIFKHEFMHAWHFKIAPKYFNQYSEFAASRYSLEYARHYNLSGLITSFHKLSGPYPAIYDWSRLNKIIPLWLK